MKIKEFSGQIFVRVEADQNDEDTQWFNAERTLDEVYRDSTEPMRVAVYKLVEVMEARRAEPHWKTVGDKKAFARATR